MNSNLFIFKDGTLKEVQPKEFCFEHAMEGYVVDNPNILSNESLGLRLPEIKAVEWTIKDSKRIDVLARYDNDTIAVIELKNVPVSKDALNQTSEYIQIVKSYDDYNSVDLIGILIGPSFEEEVLTEIGNSCSLYGIEIQRYFEEDKWYIFTKWYYNQKKSKRDYTKYKFKGDSSTLGKGRLAYTMIVKYLQLHPAISFDELKEIFPDSLVNRGNLKTIAKESEIKEEERFARYFKEPIKCFDYEIVVSSQWDIRNIDNLLDKAKQLNFEIETIKDKKT